MLPWNKTAVALAAVSVVALAGCSGSSTEPTQSAGSPSVAESATLTLASTVEPKSWDPAVAENAFYLPYYQSVYDTLIRQEPDGTLVPMLATGWEFSEDLLTLTLTLRDDVTFTDGTPFDAEAVKLNLERFRDGTAPDAANLASVTEITVVDSATVALTLAAPDPALPIYLSLAAGMMGSPAAIEAGTIATEPVGTGPFTLDTTNTVVGSQYVFTDNAEYWDQELVPYDELIFKVLTDATATVNALRAGEVNAASIANASDVVALENAGFTNNIIQIDWRGIIFFDRDGVNDEALGDVRVRQAINYAIDKQAILDNVALGLGEVTTQIFPTTSPAYDPELDSYYDYDPEKARELLAEAGYEDGLTLSLPSTNAFEAAYWTTIQQQLGEVGITVEYTDLTINDFISALVGGQYGASLMQFNSVGSPSEWKTINEYIAPNTLWNMFGNGDEELDSLIATVQNGTQEEADAALAELGTYLVENAWFAPWFRVDQTYFTDSTTSVQMQSGNAAPSIYNYAPLS